MRRCDPSGHARAPSARLHPDARRSEGGSGCPRPFPRRMRTMPGGSRRRVSKGGSARRVPTIPTSTSWCPRTAMCRSRPICGARAWTSASASGCRASPWMRKGGGSRRPRGFARCGFAASSSRAKTACATALARRRRNAWPICRPTAWTPRCSSPTRASPSGRRRTPRSASTCAMCGTTGRGRPSATTTTGWRRWAASPRRTSTAQSPRFSAWRRSDSVASPCPASRSGVRPTTNT